MSASLILTSVADLDNGAESSRIVQKGGIKRRQDKMQHHARPAIGSDTSTEVYECHGLNSKEINSVFYQEVDERMSRNSVEYPDEQAKYTFVGRWLDDIEMNSRSGHHSDSDNADNELLSQDLGNIIGIKGFFSPQSCPCGNSVQDCANYKQLKSEHSRLTGEYEKLKHQMKEITNKFKQMCKIKEQEIDVLKATISTPRSTPRQQKTTMEHLYCRECHSAKHKRLSDPEDSDQRTAAHEALRAENIRLRDELERVRIENEEKVNKLCNQLRLASEQPANKLLAKLRNENSRLRDTKGMDTIELEALKSQYLLLESQVKAMEAEHKVVDEDKNGEISRLMVELCRLQVYQPKLEMILKTERETKRELQACIERLEEQEEHLREELDKREQELQLERMRSRKDHMTGVGELQAELSRWQDKWERLQREKLNSEELLRGAKLRLSQVDARYQADLDMVKDLSERELTNAREAVNKLDQERQRLQVELEESKSKQRQAEMDQNRLMNELSGCQRQLETSLATQAADRAKLVELSQYESKYDAIRCELQHKEMSINELKDELGECRLKLDKSEQQVSELQKRLQALQRTTNEMRDKKDKELDRLRVNLNLEQYNRQVALKNVERELRASLRELESMKCRFSMRLTQQQLHQSEHERAKPKTVSQKHEDKELTCAPRSIDSGAPVDGCQQSSCSAKLVSSRREPLDCP